MFGRATITLGIGPHSSFVIIELPVGDKCMVTVNVKLATRFLKNSAFCLMVRSHRNAVPRVVLHALRRVL